MSQRELEVSTILVTPELAQDWLDTNVINRPSDPKHVAEFEHFLRTNQFKATGEPIQFVGFFDQGNHMLANGQHRLQAIVNTGISAVMVVVQGVSKDAQLVMDTGKVRKFWEILHTERSVTNASAVSTVVRLAHAYENNELHTLGTGGGQRRVNNIELLKWFDTHPACKDAQVLGERIGKASGFSGPAVAVAIMIFDDIDMTASTIFFEHLESGANLPRGDSILAARRWIADILLQARRRGQSARPRPADQIAVLIKAWNCRQEHRDTTVRSINWDRYKDTYPVPHA